MIKTQIQLPDQMYYALKKVAEQQEWSLAETIRRGSELLLNRYPSENSLVHWKLPEPQKLGCFGLSHQEIKDQILNDQEKRDQE